MDGAVGVDCELTAAAKQKMLTRLADQGREPDNALPGDLLPGSRLQSWLSLAR